jgi:hypothetical protein
MPWLLYRGGCGRCPGSRRVGLEFVEKVLPAPSTARTRRSGTPACCCSSTRVPHRHIAGRAGSWSGSKVRAWSPVVASPARPAGFGGALFSSQSSHRVRRLRSGSRMRCLVVTPPTRGVGERLEQLGQGALGPDGVAVEQHDDLARGHLYADPDRVALARHWRPGPDELPGEFVADVLEGGVAGPLMTTMVSSGACSPIRRSTSPEQLERLVHHRDDDAGGRAVGGRPVAVAAREQDLDGPQDPDRADEDGEQVERMPVLQCLAELQEQCEQRGGLSAS